MLPKYYIFYYIYSYILYTTIFCKTLNTENIKIHQPRKDQCDICVGYKLGSVSKTVYNRHVNRKTMSREEKINLKLRFQVPKL
jgi:hypothetical protein